MGTRVAEIQELVGAETWRYVDSKNNPADDITRRSFKIYLRLTLHFSTDTSPSLFALLMRRVSGALTTCPSDSEGDSSRQRRI